MSRRPRRDRSTSADDRGGVPARRAVVRWVWRMFRREWRQQVLVLALVTVTLAAAIGFATAAYNLTPVSGKSDFGTASQSFVFDDPDPEVLRRTLAAGEQYFDAVDAIGHRDVPVPGSVDTVDYRAQDPEGPYGSPLLDLRDGRYPATDDEVAVTDSIVEEFDADIGASLALDGAERTIVGVVENPSDLDDEFALLPPAAIGSSESLTMLVDTSSERARSFLSGADGDATGVADNVIYSEMGDVPESVLAALVVLVVATVALFLVSLVAAASFVVVAQRRLRQLGMLAAIGATEKHVRLVMVATGVVAGTVAGVLGTILGVAGWVVLAPRMEEAAGYRIDAFDVPWWLVVAGMLLAVITGAGAAWWPARTMARIPPVQALSGRPPRPSPTHRSAALAGAFIVGGVASLSLASDVVFNNTGDDTVSWINVSFVAAGTLAVIVGVLLVSPLAIRVLATAAARLPVAMRLALRDLGRYQARSGAALAAISLALGIPVAIVVTAAAAEQSADTGNLSDRQLLVQGSQDPGPKPPYLPEPSEVEDLQAGVDRLAASLDEPSVIALDVPVDPNAPVDPGEGRFPVELGEPQSDGFRFVSLLYVATPALLDRYGVDLDAVDPGTEFFTVETGELAILTAVPRDSGRSDPQMVTNPWTLTPTHSSLPGSFVTLDGLRQRGWEVASSGRWLVETSEPLTSEELATARDVAAGAGLTIESRDQQTGLQVLRSGATAVGMLLALGILAMTVGLIRSEAAGDVRTLTATGASGATRRTLTATTAGGLAVLGVALGTACAYLTLVAGFRGNLGDLTQVPVTNLAVIAAGTPLAAAAAGWLLAGREPPVIARQMIE